MWLGPFLTKNWPVVGGSTFGGVKMQKPRHVKALQSVSELAVAVAGAVAVVEAVLVAVIQPLVMAGCRVIRE